MRKRIEAVITMIKKVFDYIQKNHMLQAGDTVVAGISGGADSVCLLFILLKIRERLPLRLTAVHIDHGLREESAQDAAFTEGLCRRWGCDFRCIPVNVEAYAAENRISTEEAGRILRYRAFERALEEMGAPDGRIAVAHNQNDNAETVLFHLMRGTGLTGLAGISPVRERIIRPLLCMSRRDIEQFLAEKQIPYCIDRTNNEDTYTRNRIRHHILPYAEAEICGQAVSHIYDTSVIIREADAFLKKSALEAFRRCAQERAQEISFTIDAFLREDVFLQKQLLLSALSRLAGSRKDIAAVHVRLLHELFVREGNGRVSLPYGVTAYREYETVRLRIEGKEESQPGAVLEERALLIPGRTHWADGLSVISRLFPYEKSENIPQKTYTKWIDYDKIVKSLVLRTRRQGDYMQVFAGGGRKSLKSYLIDEKIPRAERDRMPLLADGGHIVWAIGGRLSERYKINVQTKTVLEIQAIGGTSDGGES